MPGPATNPSADRLTFIQGVSARTGIDSRVVAAWVQQEGADAPGGTGGDNYLNLRPYPGDPYSAISSGNFEQFSNVQNAITATVRRINQPFAAPILKAAKTPGATPASEIAAIAGTGWDAGHYGGPGGPNLLKTFQDIYGSPAGSSTASSTADTSGKNPVTGVVNAVGDAITFPERAFEFVTSWRFAEIVGGFFLLLVGLYLLGRQFGVTPPVGSLAVAAATKTPVGAISTAAISKKQTTRRASERPARSVREDLSPGPKPVYSTRARVKRASSSAGYGSVPF